MCEDQAACDLHHCVQADNCCCVCIDGALHGLKESGQTANEDVVDLALHGHRESALTPGLFAHDSHDVSFALVVMILVSSAPTKLIWTT